MNNSDIKSQQEIIENIILKRIPDLSSSSILNNIKLLTSTFPIIIILFMGLNQKKSISMGPIWNTSGTETVISVPVSVLGPERAGTEIYGLYSSTTRLRPNSST